MNSQNRSYETTWTWKKGVPMERTSREDREFNENVSCISDFSQQHVSQNEKVHEYLSSVPSKNQYESDIIKTSEMTCKRANIRCEQNEKLSTREHIIQRNVNPFLVDNDFKKDLEIQNEFLIPKNSNYEKNVSLSL